MLFPRLCLDNARMWTCLDEIILHWKAQHKVVYVYEKNKQLWSGRILSNINGWKLNI